MIKLTYIHHSCFMLENDTERIIFDPFLEGNPAGLTPQDIKVSYVLVSHAHGDHLGSTMEIAKNNQATVITTAEIADLVTSQGLTAHAMHVGGTYQFPFGKVRLTPAFHGSGIAGGHACGFIVDFYGTTVYFAGDTSLFGDMKLLGELETIDYALLPIGDNYTMGPSDAVKAVELLGVKHVIPIHYNTWPVIAQDPNQFKQAVEAQGNATVTIVAPGTTIEL
ncbi:MAG: metal-dependent hydrolase, partial [Acidaminococcaceae bacterium]